MDFTDFYAPSRGATPRYGMASPSPSRRWTGWPPVRSGATGYSNDTWPEPVRLTARWCGLPATMMSPDPVSATLAVSDA